MVNPVRGETEVVIAKGKYVLAATMESLASLSREAGCATLHDLYTRLMGTELFTTTRALVAFIQSGADAAGKPLKRREASALAVASFSLADANAVQAGFIDLLSALTRKPDDAGQDDAGNGKAAGS